MINFLKLRMSAARDFLKIDLSGTKLQKRTVFLLKDLIILFFIFGSSQCKFIFIFKIFFHSGSYSQGEWARQRHKRSKEDLSDGEITDDDNDEIEQKNSQSNDFVAQEAVGAVENPKTWQHYKVCK